MEMGSKLKTVIGQYTLISRCGHGAYGEVFQAQDISGRRVALKRIYKNQYNWDWKRELDGLIKFCKNNLKCKNLIEIYHIDENDDYFYYTMELADNLCEEGFKFIPDTLASRLHQNSIPVSAAISITQQILSGLEVLHNNNLVHRDIKPENIIFINDTPKLSDIGLVTTINTTRSFAGTMGYLPHEIVIKAMKGGRYKFTDQSDLYAVGKVLYCMVTGNTPDKFPSFPLRLARKEGMKHLNLVVNKACNKNPRMRFDNISQFQAALNVFNPNGLCINKYLKSTIVIAVASILILLAVALFIFQNWGNNILLIKQIEVPLNKEHPRTLEKASKVSKDSASMVVIPRKKIEYPQSGIFTTDLKTEDDF